MNNKIKISLISFLSILCLAFSACEEDKVPTIFNPDDTGNPAPIITGVDPADYGLISITEIKIFGNNFSTSVDSLQGNTVYIGKEKAEVLSASKTELVVKATPTPGDSLTIKVIVPGAFNIAEYFPYKLLGLQEGVDKAFLTEKVYTIAVDADDKVYGFSKQGSSGSIYKFAADGSKIDIGLAPVPISTDMKVGPNGYLYILYGFQEFYRMKISDGSVEEFVKLPERLSYFDFDQNHNIYAGGNRKGIIVTDINGAEGKIVGDFIDFNISSIRVFNNEVYVAASYSGTNNTFPKDGIFKANITSASGDLGEAVTVFDWSNAGEHSGSRIKSITFDELGNIFVGTDNRDNPILMINIDGSTVVLYPGKLFTSVGQIVYGNEKYIYQNRTVSDMTFHTIYKILTPNFGSPYYGRE